jgi:hypothetical protein
MPDGEDDKFAFLSARHVDNLTQAVIGLERTIRKDSEARRKDHVEMMLIMKQFVAHTEGIPKLVERLVEMADANGAADDH